MDDGDGREVHAHKVGDASQAAFARLVFCPVTADMNSPTGIPVEVVFTPNWWFHNYGISFGESFYLNAQQRITNDVAMRRALCERFGLGQAGAEPRPVAGSLHIAGGFVVPALLGVEIRFSDNAAPWPVPANLSRDQCLALRPPPLEDSWPMNELIPQMDALEAEVGYLIGDLNTDGVINTALQLRGQQILIDMVEDTELTEHLFGVIAETQIRVASYMRRRTGTCSVAVNRSILNVDPALYLHANCSVQMISPRLFRSQLLAHEFRLSECLRPYGIHHCGNNLHLFVDDYVGTGASFFDAGWGSDIARVRAAAPAAFLNLRLSPVRMLQQPAGRIREDVERLIAAGGDPHNVGLCCINMDYGTPDENVLALLEAAASRRNPA